MNLLSNQEEYLKVTTYLGLKNTQNQYGWNISKMKPMPSDLYINKQIGTSGNINLLDGESNNVKGVTNFDKNTLNEGRVFVINGVSFAFGYEADKTNVATVNYGIANLPSELRFATLLVKQNNEVLLKLPINSIINSYENGRKYKDLGAFALLLPQHAIEVDIEYPSGTSLKTPVDKELFVSVFFKGFETYKKR
ncbi:hypothetical protein SAMN04489761_4663 [Tenacibaculum sp. MAR_2009_124]|uniref:hypothetical protein n=1 Tax=Tenacibaculum sp. MAR_2009_124 TaxID=1250059 RepID=UPI000897F1F8|nr:hypothetical protein [Tenacibaculum sp. MAR_2009_124]SED21899.1 hypothetical protein SAMN04489761_4663 [Tenacibaculum sp. MAR_2009_124]